MEINYILQVMESTFNRFFWLMTPA